MKNIMKKILKEELKNILDEHKLWLENNGKKGKKADLSHADLSHINLSHVNLSHANLSNADLSNANLTNANLTNAYLFHVNLLKTKLIHTRLRETVAQNVKGKKVIAAQVNTSRDNNLISYWVDLDIWTTGCFQGTLEELKKAIEETHKDNQSMKRKYFIAINFILSEVEEDKREDKGLWKK